MSGIGRGLEKRKRAAKRRKSWMKRYTLVIDIGEDVNLVKSTNVCNVE
jgi:hypothetical protein